MFLGVIHHGLQKVGIVTLKVIWMGDSICGIQNNGLYVTKADAICWTHLLDLITALSLYNEGGGTVG